MKRVPESVALTVSDIFSPTMNETTARTREAMKSKLLSGVMGGASLEDFLGLPAFFFFAPGTGVPHMKHSESFAARTP